MAQEEIEPKKKPLTLKKTAEDINSQAKQIKELEAKLKKLTDKNAKMEDDHPQTARRIKAAKYIKDNKTRDLELVSGIFRFFEVAGGTLTFTYGKYKGHTKDYVLKDGERYKLPRCVANHLHNSGEYPIHEYQTDENGVPVIRIGRKKRRYSFDSVETFRNDADSRIFTAKKVILK